MKRHAKRAAWSKMTTRPRPLREIPDLWFLSIRGRLERNPRTTVGFVGDDGLQWACSRPFWSLEEPTPFIIEPPGFDGDLLKPGATWNEHGQLHSKVQQRMVVTSARLVKTDKAAGNAEYEIDAYCVDENFSPPVEKTQ